MLSRVCVSVAVVLLGAGSLSVEAPADVAVSLDPKPLAGTPTPDSGHGWQFDVNGPIVVTHLGLFDDDDDGFSIDFPIGLFRLSDEVLLTSGTMSAGIGDALLDHFRSWWLGRCCGQLAGPNLYGREIGDLSPITRKPRFHVGKRLPASFLALKIIPTLF